MLVPFDFAPVAIKRVILWSVGSADSGIYFYPIKPVFLGWSIVEMTSNDDVNPHPFPSASFICRVSNKYSWILLNELYLPAFINNFIYTVSSRHGLRTRIYLNQICNLKWLFFYAWWSSKLLPRDQFSLALLSAESCYSICKSGLHDLSVDLVGQSEADNFENQQW